MKVPYAFSIVAGPLGATGPDLITNHTFAMAQQLANSIAAAQKAAGVEPLGLIGYPGLHDLVRDGDPTAGNAPQPVDFYSPDTFNFNVLDVSADGKTLTVTSVGMDSTAQNAGIEYANGPQARQLFSFKVDVAPRTAASAGPKGTTTVNRQITLDGTASTSADGKPLTYLWSIPQGQGYPSAAIFQETTATPTVQFGRARGVYTFQLTVTDSTGVSASDFVTVNFQGN